MRRVCGVGLDVEVELELADVLELGLSGVDVEVELDLADVDVEEEQVLEVSSTIAG